MNLAESTFARKFRRFYNLAMKSLEIIKDRGIKFFIILFFIRLKSELISRKNYQLEQSFNGSKETKIDIILYIEANYFSARKCLESILSYTEEGIYNLLVVYDRNAGANVKRYLYYLKENLPRIKFNLTDNKSDWTKSFADIVENNNNNLIIINNDIIVKFGWLDLLLNQVNSTNKIFTKILLVDGQLYPSIIHIRKLNALSIGYTPRKLFDYIKRLRTDDINVSDNNHSLMRIPNDRMISTHIGETSGKYDNMRIGFDGQLLTRSNWAGSEIYIFNLLNNIVKEDYNYEYVLYSKINLFDKYMDINKNFIRKFADNSLEILLDSESIDVFHRPCQCFSVIDLLLLLKSRASVITLLDLISYNNLYYFNTNQEAELYRSLMRLSAHIADRIIAISGHNKIDIIRNLGVSEDKVDVIYLGVDKRFKPLKDKKILESFAIRYNLPNEYVLYVGADYPHKNVYNLICAYNQLAQIMNNPPNLVIAGPCFWSGKDRTLKDIIDKNSKIQRIDYVEDEDILSLYNCAKILVYPSLYEGFGLPILEAMACGVPVVASNATSIPEVTGDAALLVDAADINDLCLGIYRVLNDHNFRQYLIEKGLQRAKEFTWEKTTRKTIDTYRIALENARCMDDKLDGSTLELIKDLLKNGPEEEKYLIKDALENLNVGLL